MYEKLTIMATSSFVNEKNTSDKHRSE